MESFADVFHFELTAGEMKALAMLTTPGGEGDARNDDPAAMMCLDGESGKMARCLYLDYK